LITGASSGLGRATALAFARDGARVALAARSTGALETVAREVDALGSEAIAIPTDVANPDDIAACVTRASAHFGPIQTLVSNAGMNVPVSILDLSLDDWERIQATNLRAAFLLTRAVLPGMLEQEDGHLFLVGSVVGQRPKIGASAYGAAKAGLMNFALSLNLEFAERGIRTTTIVPGAIDTPWFDDRPDLDRSLLLDPEQMAAAIVAVANLAPSTPVTELHFRPRREIPPRPEHRG
jgi:NAD(P)-dependent dehydrogenase (short-subunit alcohol dehydrogenase family)